MEGSRIGGEVGKKIEGKEGSIRDEI